MSLIPVCLALFASAAYGQATRTWVSGVGDDANPCSRTAPCKTFAGAISKTAAGGEIDVLDPSGFGALTITKSIHINGSASLGGVLVSGTDGVVVNAGVNDVVSLKGLVIDGASNSSSLRGIRLLSAKALTIEDCDIFGFGLRGISIEPTNNTNAPSVFIRDTTVHSNLSNGIVIQNGGGLTPNVTMENVHVVNNVNFGISMTSSTSVTVRHSVLTNNAAAGVRMDASTGLSNLVMDDVLIGGSSIGMDLAAGAPSATLSNCSLVDDTTGLQIVGGSVVSFGNNRFVNTGGSGPTSTRTMQ